MKLYHGSNIIIDEIRLEKYRPYKDFGKGFYLTDLLAQAKRMAMRTARIYKGRPVVTAFEFDYEMAERNGLKILRFDKPCYEWARFVMKNRDIEISQPCHDYDLVIGPVADDTISRLLRMYTEELISAEQLVQELTFANVTSQYMFHTEEAVKFLKAI